MTTWAEWITARCSLRVLAGGAAVAGVLAVAFLRRPEAGAEHTRAWGSQRRMDAPVSVALTRLRTASVVPFTSHSSAFPGAASLRSLISRVIADARAPVAIRNHCHRLMAALESDNQTLVDESLVSLEQVAERTGYRLPPSNRIPARHSI